MSREFLDFLKEAANFPLTLPFNCGGNVLSACTMQPDFVNHLPNKSPSISVWENIWNLFMKSTTRFRNCLWNANVCEEDTFFFQTERMKKETAVTHTETKTGQLRVVTRGECHSPLRACGEHLRQQPPNLRFSREAAKA